MEIITFESFINNKILINEKISATIGVFDGIHKGHRKLIKSTTADKHTKSLVITFKNNPKAFLPHREYTGSISTISQRLKCFEELKIDYVVMIDFSSDFSKLFGEEFMQHILNSCRLHKLFIGSNFHCGYKGSFSAGDTKKMLTSKGVVVEIIEPLLYDNSIVISSTIIRNAIKEGDLELAEKLINRAYSLDLADLPQKQENKAIYICKDDIMQVLPPPGTYSACYRIEEEYNCEKSITVIDNQYIVIPVKFENQKKKILNVEFKSIRR
ncbi:MAG: FAD synthetase family protein [Spirochaetia bacterium]|nr:FAD synthetase family protein [Spirochaetia bacterium]